MRKLRLTDVVFKTLLSAILRGDLKPGSTVPSRSYLAREFGVSTLVVLEALHRLEELNLVRLRQGAASIVLEPTESLDIRLIELQLCMARSGDAIALTAGELRAAFGLQLLALAERRLTRTAITRLERLVASYSLEMTDQAHADFLKRYWTLIADATHNPLLRHQVRWWLRVSRKMEANGSLFARRLTPSFYEELNSALRLRSGSIEIWLRHVDTLCTWTEAQPEHPLKLLHRPVAR